MRKFLFLRGTLATNFVYDNQVPESPGGVEKEVAGKIDSYFVVLPNLRTDFPKN